MSRPSWSARAPAANSTPGAVIAANVAAGAQGRAFAKPGLTREQVKAELDRARANGEIGYAPEHGGRH
jgi:Domain of unknown function (DUF4148)